MSVFVKKSGNIMFKYPPTVEDINQFETTTLNQPFQIEFTVLPAKSDSESNLQDRIKTASSNVRCISLLYLDLYVLGDDALMS